MSKRSFSLILDFFSKSRDSYSINDENEPPSKCKKIDNKKRQSGFNKEWTKDYKWLEELENGM